MADRRRLRPAKSSQEVLSEGESQVPQSLSLSQSEGGSQGGYVDLSEYESEDDAYQSSQSSEEEEEQVEEAAEEQFEDASEDTKEVERESGDGKEQSDSDLEPKKNFVNVSEECQDTEEKKDDDDDEEEEKESPCFIPKKGNFFQHDTRSDNLRGGRVMVRNFRTRPDSNRWLHDKFDEHEQTPKSREDLIAEYGYDIRAHSPNKPPPQNRGNPRGQRRPFGRRDMNRGHHHPQYNNVQNSYNNEDRKEWPTLNKERPRLPPSQSRYRETEIRTQDFRARRNYGNMQRDQEHHYREPRHHNDRHVKPEYPRKPKNSEPLSRQSPPQSDNDEEEWDVPSHSTEDKAEKQPSPQKSKYSAENRRPQPQAYSQQRHGKREGKLTEKLKNISISQSREQPRRYSSLRQRNADSPTEQQKPQNYPMAPTIPPEWTKQKDKKKHQPNENQPRSSAASSSGHMYSNHLPAEGNAGLQHKDVPIVSYMQHANHSPAPVSTSPAVPYSIADFNPPVSDIGKTDSSLMSSEAAALASQMQWYETAMAYQAMLSSQNVLNHPPPPTLPPLLPQQRSLLPNADQVGTSGMMVGEDHKQPAQPQMPLVSQAGTPDLGALGSLAFPPPLPHNFTQNDFMQRSMLSERPMVPPMQLPFPHNPGGLMGQQVGGVTYYGNLPHSVPISVPNIMQGNTPIGSPLRNINSAIPIRPPME